MELEAKESSMSETNSDMRLRATSIDIARSHVSFSSNTNFKSSKSIQPTKRKKEKAKRVSGLVRLKRSLRKVWQTKLSENIPEDEQERTLKTTLRELIIYLAFVVILCIVGFCMLDPTMFYFTKVLKGLFVDSNDSEFEKISKHEDFFNYAVGTLVNGLYWEQYYNGKDVKDEEINYIYFENKLLGLPRIRQIRIQNQSCDVPDELSNLIKICLTSYSEDKEDKNSFGIKNGTAWVYNTAEEIKGLGVQGRFTTYSGGAFYELLGPDKFQSIKKIEELKNNMWLDRQTRAVIIDISVYNANINMFCIMTLILEFPPTGAAVPFYQFNTLKLLRYVTTLDYFVMACEGMLVIFLIYYIVEEIIEIKTLRWDYLKHFWNLIDVTLILLVFGTIIFNLYRTFNVSTKLKIILDDYDKDYGNFEELSGQQQTYNDIIAVTLFIAWIKVFKYISFNQTLNELQNTLSTCAADMAAFSFMFFLVFLAYAQWGYLLFGYMVHDFRTYFDSVFALFRVILGDFDFLALQEANRTMGPAFFISYIFVIFFIMLNMFLAILFDTYAEVREEMGEDDGEKIGVGDLFSKSMDNLILKLTNKKKKIENIQQAVDVADKNNDQLIDYEEWKNELSERGYNKLEIEELFKKYDLGNDGILDFEDQVFMKKDLDEQERQVMIEIIESTKAKTEAKKYSKQTSLSSSSSGDDSDDDSGDDSDGEEDEENALATQEQIETLGERIEKAEDDVADVIKKIDSALLKLEAMDKTILPGRDSMSRVLQSMHYGRSDRKISAFFDDTTFSPGNSNLSVRRISKVSTKSDVSND